MMMMMMIILVPELSEESCAHVLHNHVKCELFWYLVCSFLDSYVLKGFRSACFVGVFQNLNNFDIVDSEINKFWFYDEYVESFNSEYL